jgi:hypothetical protein
VEVARELELVALQLLPRDPDHCPAVCGKSTVAGPVLLEPSRRVVERSPVELDD